MRFVFMRQSMYKKKFARVSARGSARGSARIFTSICYELPR